MAEAVEKDNAMGLDEKVKVFRANMCLIHILYRKIMRTATRKNEKVNLESWGDEALYWMLGTNSSDLSKYKNGKMIKATKVMLTKTQGCIPLYNALLGEELLYKDISMARWEQYYNKVNRKEVEEQIGRLVENLFKGSDKDKRLYEATQWIADQLVYYIKERNGSSTEIVKNAYKGIAKLKFEDYDACSLDELKQAYNIQKEQNKFLSTVLQYKQQKERKIK